MSRYYKYSIIEYGKARNNIEYCKRLIRTNYYIIRLFWICYFKLKDIKYYEIKHF